jgi:hypothetical protein
LRQCQLPFSSFCVLPLASALTHCDPQSSNSLTNFTEFVLRRPETCQ